MVKQIKKITTITAALIFTIFLVSGCGQGNSAKALINGQEVDLNVSSVDIIAGGVGGSVVPGSVGYPTSAGSLQIVMSLSGGGAFNDTIQLFVLNVNAVSLGQVLPIDGSNVNAMAIIGGIPQNVLGGSLIFDSIHNVSGRNVSGSFKLDVGGASYGVIYGDFSDNVQGF